MQPTLQYELLRRIAAHHAAGTTDARGQARAFDARVYTDDKHLRGEADTLFRRFPVRVGFTAELKVPGDYITRDVGDVPVLVCRQPDGSLKAFLNICRHRGAKLVAEPAGHMERVFVCPYHAWTYAGDGHLHARPCESHFASLAPVDSGLHELPVHERFGIVFVVPSRHVPPIDMAAWFGDYGNELVSFGLGDWEVYDSRTVACKFNWKMMIEANREGYHISMLHRDTAGPRYMPQLALGDTQAAHSRIALVYRHFTAEALAVNPDEARILPFADVVYFLFPNTLVLLSAVSANILTAFPDGPNNTVVQAATLVPPGTTEKYLRPLYKRYWMTINEDIVVSEPIQASARADPKLQLWFGANEFLLSHFHDSIASAIRGELTAW